MKMTNKTKLTHPQIMSRVLNRPLLLESRYSRTFVNALASAGNTTVNFIDGAGANLDVDGAPTRQQKSYGQVNGVAVLPVSGTLVHKYGHVQPYSGCTGYDGIRARIQAAAADPEIHTIMLDLDSPGGEVAGCQELAGVIASTDKPVVAYVDELAASAAYWIASACDLVVGPPSARVGSVGIVWMHTDLSQRMENEGVDITFIHAGRHKVDGNPYEALSDDVRASFQAEIDELYNMFVAAVAAGRPNMSEIQVRQTEARVYLADAAMEIGLVDGVMSRGDFMSFLSVSGNDEATTLTAESLSSFTLEKPAVNFEASNSKGSKMGSKTNTDDAVETEDTFSSADLAAAEEKVRAEAVEKYKQEVAAAGVRAKAIFSHADASADIKDMLSGDAFASVETESLISLMDALPKGFSSSMDTVGGAGVDAQPQDFVDDAASAAGAAKTDAADQLQKSTFAII